MRRREFLRHVTRYGTLGAASPLLAHALGAEPASPFLQGNFAPVHEEVTADDLKVIGKLPAEMDGMFVRNGPNPQFPPRGKYHWFDGDGMLHGVRLRGGKASYRNRYIRTAGWKEEHAAGKAVFGGLLDPPDPRRLLSGQPYKNAANTALVWHAGKFLALWEGGPPHEIRVPGLETVGPHGFGGKLRHPFTAHPKVDPVTGEMMFFGYQPIPPFLQYSVADRQGVIVRTTPITLPRPVMMHDFAITERYTVFMDLPETFDFTRLARGESPFQFQPQLGSRFGILPRHGKGDAVRWFESPACFVFHTLNAFEDGDAVVLLACRMKEFPDALGGAPSKDGGQLNGGTMPVLYRWRFDLKTGKVQEGPLDDAPCEFPRHHEALVGRPTRFGYAGRAGDEMFTGLLKYDLEKQSRQIHEHGPGRTGGEGVFVPRPDAKEEDDGWLVTYVHARAENRSELLVVDARDFGAAPLARVLLPQRVPYGFHGTWLDAGRLGGMG